MAHCPDPPGVTTWMGKTINGATYEITVYCVHGKDGNHVAAPVMARIS